MKVWGCKFELNLTDSNTAAPQYVDICSILDGKEIFILPKHYNGIQNRQKLITDLKVCAVKSGFALVHRSSKSDKQVKKDNLLAYITLQCQHGIKFKGKEKVHNQVYKTKYCCEPEGMCQFRINLSLCKITNSWRIHNSKASKRGKQSMHTGHFKLTPEHIHSNIELLPNEEIELARQCSQLHMSNSTMASLISIRNALGIDNTWNRHQISYKSKKINGFLNSNPNGSSAQKIIEIFNSRNDVNYLYVTYKPSEGLMLMTGKSWHKYKFLYLLINELSMKYIYWKTIQQ